jgi:hypothetical protein
LNYEITAFTLIVFNNVEKNLESGLLLHTQLAGFCIRSHLGGMRRTFCKVFLLAVQNQKRALPGEGRLATTTNFQ